MNNDELKKKIVDILSDNIRWVPYYFISRGIVYDDDLKNIADALIDAGMGDVKEAEFEADHYWRMWQGALEELERAEHRAKVAELVVKNLNDIFTFDYQTVFEQAEKELSEERK